MTISQDSAIHALLAKEGTDADTFLLVARALTPAIRSTVARSFAERFAALDACLAAQERLLAQSSEQIPLSPELSSSISLARMIIENIRSDLGQSNVPAEAGAQIPAVAA